MVNPDMFKGLFPAPAPMKPKPVAKPTPQQSLYEDPEIGKLKLFFLKWLSILIGGAAILLIVWRIFLKFL